MSAGSLYTAILHYIRVWDLIVNAFLFANSESFKKKSQMACLASFFIKKQKTLVLMMKLSINILEVTLFLFEMKMPRN